MYQNPAALRGPGSPAHAGIDLAAAVAKSPPLRFPRTRGDRPLATAILSAYGAVPPHTRG